MLFSAALQTIEQGVSLPNTTATELHKTACFPNEGLQVVVWLEHNEPVAHKLIVFAVPTDMPIFNYTQKVIVKIR